MDILYNLQYRIWIPLYFAFDNQIWSHIYYVTLHCQIKPYKMPDAMCWNKMDRTNMSGLRVNANGYNLRNLTKLNIWKWYTIFWGHPSCHLSSKSGNVPKYEIINFTFLTVYRLCCKIFKGIWRKVKLYIYAIFFYEMKQNPTTSGGENLPLAEQPHSQLIIFLIMQEGKVIII